MSTPKETVFNSPAVSESDSQNEIAHADSNTASSSLATPSDRVEALASLISDSVPPEPLDHFGLSLNQASQSISEITDSEEYETLYSSDDMAPSTHSSATPLIKRVSGRHVGNAEPPRSPSPEYIMANSSTVREFVKLIRDNNIRLPDPKWSEPITHTEDDYVTPQNPRSAHEINIHLGGQKMVAKGDLFKHTKLKNLPIKCLEPQVRSSIIKLAMAVPWVAPYEYYKEYPQAASAQHPPKPNVSLLRAGKEIGEEAAHFLYACNTFFFKEPDFFIVFMSSVGVTNLLRMDIATSVVLVDPFSMILRNFEADWLLKNLPLLQGVMEGNFTDEWDVAWKEYLRSVHEKDPSVYEAEDRFPSEEKAARVMEAFGEVGKPENIRELGTLMKSKEVLWHVFGEEKYMEWFGGTTGYAVVMGDDEEDFVELGEEATGEEAAAEEDSGDSEEDSGEEEEDSEEEAGWGNEDDGFGEEGDGDPFTDQDDASSAWETVASQASAWA